MLCTILILVVVLASACCPVTPGSGMVLADETLSGNELIVDVDAGRVSIASWDGENIHVQAIQTRGWTTGFDVGVTQEKDIVKVTGLKRFGYPFFLPRSIEYIISVPSKVAIQVTTGSGNIAIEGAIIGNITVGTGSGEISAKSVKGDIEATTGSGSIRLDEIDGSLNLRSGSGSLVLTNGRVTGTTAETGSGSIRLQGVSGAIALRSGSGSIDVREAADAQLDLQTSSGSINVEAAQNAGLDLQTSSGSIQFTGSLVREGVQTIRSSSGSVRVGLPGGSNFELKASYQ